MDVSSFGTWGMLGNYVPLASCVTVATPCWGFEAQHGYRVGRTWSDLQSLVIPCFFFFLSTTAVTLPFFEGGAHTIEQGTQQFGVRQFGNLLTLCIWSC